MSKRNQGPAEFNIESGLEGLTIALGNDDGSLDISEEALLRELAELAGESHAGGSYTGESYSGKAYDGEPYMETSLMETSLAETSLMDVFSATKPHCDMGNGAGFDCGMVRPPPLDTADYNVEHVQFTAEDENDPALLAELSMLTGSSETATQAEANPRKHSQLKPNCQNNNQDSNQCSPDAIVQDNPKCSIHEANPEESIHIPPSGLPELDEMLKSKNVDQISLWIQECKIRAVLSKKSNDTKEMHRAFHAYKQLATHLDQLKNTQPSSVDCAKSPNHTVSLASTNPIKCEQRAGTRAKGISMSTKEACERLAQQIEECKSLVRTMIKAENKPEATKFLARQKAFETDLITIRAKLLANQNKIVVQTIPFTIPVNVQLNDIDPNELHLTFTDWKSLKKLAKEIKDRDTLFIKTILDWPPEASETDRIKVSSLFNYPANPNLRLVYSTLRRDLRAVKFFEHHKLKVELVRVESGFLRKKNVNIGWGTVRLQPLLTNSQVEETIELFDEGKKPLGLGINIIMAIKCPLGGNREKYKTKVVEWIVVDGESLSKLLDNGTNSSLSTPSKSTTNQANDKEFHLANKKAERSKSYVVIEYELEQLNKDPRLNQDPILLAYQLALERRRDAMSMQVELGQLSMAEYIHQVKMAIAEKKREALEAKRAGRMELAKQCLIHLKLMEDEVDEVGEVDETGGADEPGEADDEAKTTTSQDA